MAMEESRVCIACGAELVGPLESRMTLTEALSEEESGQNPLAVEVGAWICSSCGLVHWYGEEEALAEMLAVAQGDEALAARPDSSYKRRVQMLRMLRQVRRM